MQAGVMKAVETYRANSNDTNIFYRLLEPNPSVQDPELEPKVDWALLAHWSVKGHSKVASALANAITNVTKWEKKSEPTPCPVMAPVYAIVEAPSDNRLCA